MYYEKIYGALRWFRRRPFLSFALVHAILIMAVFASLDHLVGGNSFEMGFALRILDGMLPYSDFASEYPPLALFSFLVPALFTTTQPLYDILFALEIYLLDLLILFILLKFAARLNLRAWSVLGIYSLCLVAVGPIVTGRFDLLPAALVLVALYAFTSGRNKTAWGFLALGAAAKLYPLVIAPLFFLYLLRRGQYRRLTQGIAIFGGVILALHLPWVIIDADGFWQFASYHVERGLHSESSYGSVILVGQLMGLTQVSAGLTYGSWNIISPLADALADSSFYITTSLLLIAYVFYARRLWQKPDGLSVEKATTREMAALILRYTLIAVFIMLLTSKVFSPQFMIWLCPLIPLARARWPYIPLLLFFIAGAITQYIYPHNYVQFELFIPRFVLLHALRNLLLVAVAVAYLLPVRPLPATAGVDAANGR